MSAAFIMAVADIGIIRAIAVFSTSRCVDKSPALKPTLRSHAQSSQHDSGARLFSTNSRLEKGE
jgi:hypothetical protein